MDFRTLAKLGSYISKDYAEGFFERLVNYQDISASEAASRLNLHITTSQEFLDALTSLDILHKNEVSEGKRPYFRYSLKQKKILLELDLSVLRKERDDSLQGRKIRERKNTNARFSTTRNNQRIASVAIWTGEGRGHKERKISLTDPQGNFLFYLPFPNAEYLSISEIMRKADIDESLTPEILDIVELLEKHNIIESVQ
ncbi:hypothetical protein ACFL7D_07835 [candidate division KSB1 bacterium]